MTAGSESLTATREEEYRVALAAIAGSDGSWNVAAYAQDVLDGTYRESPVKRYDLDPEDVKRAVESFLDNEERRIQQLREAFGAVLNV